MTYEDLPFYYRQHAEITKEWTRETALARWQEAEEYRNYLVSRLLLQYRASICDPEHGLQKSWATNEALFSARGKRAEIV